MLGDLNPPPGASGRGGSWGRGNRYLTKCNLLKKLSGKNNFGGLKLERTLSIIKPDGVEKNLIGEVISRFEKKGLRVAALKMVKLTKKDAEDFYIVHKDRPFYGSLTDFMSRGPVVLMVLVGENAIAKNREIMGATDPAQASEGTIRKDFATSIEENTVHGSDSPESAAFEIGYFFSALELCS
jgi:nucleoside-diphosphate kinase